MLRVGVLCSGGGTNLQAIIDAIRDGRITAEVGLVIASKPDAYALERAKLNSIPFEYAGKRDFKEPGAYESRLINLLNGCNIELVITAGFNIVLDESFTKAFEGRIMNVHPTLIPSFCGKGFYGLKVHQAVLDAGVKITGGTVHFVTDQLDGGPIIIQKPVRVLEDDTPETLQRRVMEEAEWQILPEAIQLFADKKLRVEGNKVRIID